MADIVKTSIKVGAVAAAGLALFGLGYVVGSALEFSKADEKVDELEKENSRLYSALDKAKERCSAFAYALNATVREINEHSIDEDDEDDIKTLDDLLEAEE